MNDCLFFGDNRNPYLILNEPEKIIKPIQFKFENENENENQIKQISTGAFGIIFLFKNGKAIEYFQQKPQKNEIKKPEQIPIKKIKKIQLNGSFATILTKEGNAFIRKTLLNPKNPNEFINISSQIKKKKDRIIENIVCARSSVYLLTSNHNAYGIGSNDFGQLGFDSKKLKKTEKPILMMKNVSKIFSGNFSYCVFLLNSNQELFVCGKIIDIKCAHDHSIIKLYSCGNYQYNGLGKYDKNTYEFTEIKSSLFENDDILEISVGIYHTLILTSKGKLIVFGYNYYCQLGTGDTNDQLIPIQIKFPKLRFNEDISNYHISCGGFSSFIYYSSPSFSNLEEDLIKLFERKEFCDISFKTKNGEIIEAHKLILKYRLNQNENEIEKLKEIISKKSIKESNQIFEMIYSNRIINPKLYSEIKEIINSNEKIEETMKRIYLNENEKDFIIERKEKQYKFPKLILIMRSELYRGMFLSVTNDKSNKVTDYSELSNKSFQIFEYWIYSNQIKDKIQITQQIINEIKIGIDYFQLNQTNPNLFI
ncbi:rcc1 and btb domain-containing protein [Anaeramoeba ignava]|uniref:Rcc1 and btb domain-containing protein n=1 Tax=Anaeramoeba ignava TaxID=1746090 RepID=A0A9Q0LIC1_ANAIG|nr:rcc1 and btb domain-containing protein [Anaeramoeba ignava]